MLIFVTLFNICGGLFSTWILNKGRGTGRLTPSETNKCADHMVSVSMNDGNRVTTFLVKETNERM